MKVLHFLMFNRFVKLYLNSNHWFLQWSKRVKSVVLEMWYTLSVFFPYLIILMLPTLVFGFQTMGSFSLIELPSLIAFGVLMIALINKDFFKGQSVVHRRLGYQVVDITTNETAGKMKCMLRNITAPLWPLEVIFILAYPKRRLGDFIAGTVLIDVPPSNPELILNDIKETVFDSQSRLTLLLSTIWIAIQMTLLNPRVMMWLIESNQH